MNYNIDYIDILIRRCLDRTATTEERKILLRVLKYTSDAKIGGRILAAFQQEQVPQEPTGDVWLKIEQQIFEEAAVRHISIYRRVLPLLKYVAVALLFLSIPLYFFKDNISPAVTELQLVREVKEVFNIQSKSIKSEEFTSEIQLVLSENRTVNLPEGGHSDVINAEEYINVLHSDKQITYTLKDSIQQQTPQVVYHTVKVPYGKRFSVKLIDGTEVSLNSGTELRYPINVKEQQMDIYLKGEAYFDVAKSIKRRFNVHVYGSGDKKEHIVQVLGTQFNIKAFPEEKQSITTLFEGSVQISGIDSVPVHLVPSQQIAISRSFVVSEADLEGALSWRNGIFYFKYTPLEEVCSELQRWYGVRIRCEKGGGSKKLLAQISRSKTLQEVLDMLAQTYDVKYEYQGKEVIVMD